MDKIDSLIKTLTEFKEELNKNMNASYGATTPNMTKEEIEKGAANPALAPKEVKIKKLQAQIDAGTYKPNASKIADKMLQKEEDGVEELHCSANGQWKIMEKAKRDISNYDSDHPIHAALSHEADKRTHAETGVHVHDQKGISEHGENSWYGAHSRHLENATNEWESGKLKFPKVKT